MGNDSSELTVDVSSRRGDWGEYLLRHPRAGVYHDSRWGEIMSRAYGNWPFYLAARRDGQIVGVLQLVEQKSIMFGHHLCSVPYFDAAGVLADDEPAAEALIFEATRVMADCGADWVELRQLESLDNPKPLPARTDKVTMWLNLPEGGEAMWKQLKTKVRTKVRKSQKNNLVVEQGGAEFIADFYSVYSRTMRDLGSPPQSKRFFRMTANAFADEVMFFVVRLGGDVLAASFTLTDKLGFHVPWSGSDIRFRKLAANRLLYWSMLEYAAENKCPMFDFGRSTRDSGTYGFKKEWGAEEVPLFWHYILPEGRQEMPELRPDSPKYRLMVACWKKLPLSLARILGPRIISKLS